jgi:hypothetical protein
VSPPPSYIFASSRSRREVASTRTGSRRGLALVLFVLIAFWAGLGLGAAVLFAGVSL